MRHLVTWCPYDDQALLSVTLEGEQPVQFVGKCMHAAMANFVVETGDDLRTQMPELAAHLVGVKARQKVEETPMPVRLMWNHDDTKAILYDAVKDWAFGPLFSDDNNLTASENARLFLGWLHTIGHPDPRTLTESELEKAHADWIVGKRGGAKPSSGRVPS